MCVTLSARDMENRRLKKRHKRLLLIAILVATITYQAGLDPPGGVWPDDRDGHSAGDPILLSTHPRRYKVFFYCNSSAFMVSLAAIVMLQNEKLLKSHTTLLVTMMLDMFALMGAYAAGSWRDVRSSIYVVAMAGGVTVHMIAHILLFVSPNLYRLAIRCYALYACIVLALLGLMVAYIAGSASIVGSSIYVITLVAVMISFIAAGTIRFRLFLLEKDREEDEEDGEDDEVDEEDGEDDEVDEDDDEVDEED